MDTPTSRRREIEASQAAKSRCSEFGKVKKCINEMLYNALRKVADGINIRLTETAICLKKLLTSRGDKKPEGTSNSATPPVDVPLVDPYDMPRPAAVSEKDEKTTDEADRNDGLDTVLKDMDALKGDASDSVLEACNPHRLGEYIKNLGIYSDVKAMYEATTKMMNDTNPLTRLGSASA